MMPFVIHKPLISYQLTQHPVLPQRCKTHLVGAAVTAIAFITPAAAGLIIAVHLTAPCALGLYMRQRHVQAWLLEPVGAIYCRAL